MCCYERCLCVYQTINDEVDGAVEDYEAPVKLLKIVSQEHSIPTPSCQKSYHVIKVKEVKIVKEVKKRVMDCDFSELISLQRLENCLSGTFQFHTKR